MYCSREDFFLARRAVVALLAVKNSIYRQTYCGYALDLALQTSVLAIMLWISPDSRVATPGRVILRTFRIESGPDAMSSVTREGAYYWLSFQTERLLICVPRELQNRPRDVLVPVRLRSNHAGNTKLTIPSKLESVYRLDRRDSRGDDFGGG